MNFDRWYRRMAEAERGDGWLVACDEAGRYLAPCRELVDALAELLGWLVAELGGPVLEVCAGAGELAAALCEAGVPVLATDADPSTPGVRRMSAEAALAEHRPRVVLGVFVPVDAGVDEAVMRCPTVRHYVVLGARIGGQFGSAALWQQPGWTGRPLDEVADRMLTRHDVWLGHADRPVLRHGEAWHFEMEVSSQV